MRWMIEKAYDDVERPSHYASGDIECIDAMESAASGFDLGPFEGYLWLNAFKYVFRWPKKNGVEDLKKAKWYINRLIATLEDAQTANSR